MSVGNPDGELRLKRQYTFAAEVALKHFRQSYPKLADTVEIDLMLETTDDVRSTWDQIQKKAPTAVVGFAFSRWVSVARSKMFQQKNLTITKNSSQIGARSSFLLGWLVRQSSHF